MVLKSLQGVMVAEQRFFHLVDTGSAPLRDAHDNGRDDDPTNEAADANKNQGPNWKRFGRRRGRV